MAWEAWFTLAVVVGILVLLVRESLPTDIVMVGALTLLVAVGEMRDSDMLPSIGQAVAGMGNTGLITVGVLFVVVAGLVQTGAMELVAGPIIGQPKTAPLRPGAAAHAGHHAQRVPQQHAGRGDVHAGGRRHLQALADQSVEALHADGLRGDVRRRLHARGHQHQPDRARPARSKTASPA